MGAGLPKHLVKQRIRRSLQKLAAQHGGTYSKFVAEGVTNGLKWRAGIGVIGASNGEQFGMDQVEVTGPAGPRVYGYSLEKALYTYGVDTAPEAPEGQPGAYSALFSWPGFFQTWGWKECIALDSWSHKMAPTSDHTGFTLFDCVGKRELRITGEEADKLAPLAYQLIRPNVRIDLKRSFRDHADLRDSYYLAAARADGIAALVERYKDDSRWVTTNDWRAAANYCFGSPFTKPFGLPEMPQPGQGVW